MLPAITGPLYDTTREAARRGEVARKLEKAKAAQLVP